MTPRQRINASLRHEQPDVCPWAIGFTHGARQKMIAYTGDPDFESKLGNHLGGFGPILPMEQDPHCPDFWQDEFGVRWNRSIDKDIGNPDALIFPRPELGDYRFPDPADPRRWEGVAPSLAAQGDLFPIMNIGFSLFERAWTMRGMANLLMDMIDHPQFVDDLFDAITEFNLALIARGVKFDVDAVMFGDDWGQQQGMIMGPTLWRRFIKPRLREMYGAVHAAGKYVFIHSCGKVSEVFPDLIEVGLNCFNPFQPEVIDVYAAKRDFGDRLSFFGGVSTQRLLPYGTPEQVTAEVRRLIAEVGKSGGYILAPAHGIPRDAKPENMMALIEAVQNQ
jgi:uroporphyrinogen decarboxylase